MRCQLGLVVLCALLAGALLRDVFVDRARAEEAAVRRNDVDRIVRAVEAQAKATADVARAIVDAARACK
jgi:hypothetical protein